MNRCGIRGVLFRKAAAIFIALCFLTAPITAMAEDGGKYFKKGRKFENAEEWDLAAEQYALALSNNPSNPEFKLHLIRALTRASLMFMERGKTLAEQTDYEGAYQAYRQAYSYDNTNELALTRMKEMLEKQGIPVDQSDLPQTEIKKASERVEQFNQLKPVMRKFKPKDIRFRDTPMSAIIRSLAEMEGLNVIFENTVTRQLETTKTNFELKGISAPRALEIFLTANRYNYAQVDRRTIIIFADALANRQRYDDLAMRTFYLKNVPMSEARGALQIAFAGKQLQVAELKQLNALMVRETPDNLKLVEAILNSIDKTQAEVVLDVNIYEVSNQAMQQIGNQFATPGDGITGTTVGNLGGIGQSGLRRVSPGGLFSPIFGAALAAPPTVLSLLQSKTDSKLVASTQIRAFEGKAATVNIGSRVPVQTATLPTSTVVTTPTNPQNPNQPNQPGGGQVLNPNSFGVAQFQYVDVGLNINITPTVLNDYVQMDMEIESTGLAAGPTPLNPAFTQRRMKGVARIKESETGVVANVMRLDNSSGRSGLPVISFLPIVGRLFSTPTTKTDNTNVVITVTPHVLRAPEVGPEDRLAIGPNGTALGPGVSVSLEELITRAEKAEEILQKASLPSGASQPQPNQTAGNANAGVAVKPNPVNNQPGGNGSVIQPTSSQTPVQPVQQPVQQLQPVPQQPPDQQPQQQPDSAQQQSVASPVTVTVRVLNDNIRVGQGGLIGIICTSSNASLAGAIIGMRFNPNVIKVTSVRDGGLLSLLGAQAEFTHTDGGDSVSISIQRPVGAQPVNANGQIALIYFQGVGEGSADLAMTDMQLFGPDGQAIPYTIINGNIQVQGGGQQTPPQPGDDDDDDDDE